MCTIVSKNNPLTNLLDEKFPIGDALQPENFKTIATTEEEKVELI